MIVWIKEHERVFNQKSISMWFRSDIPIKKFTDISEIEEQDILIVCRVDFAEVARYRYQYNIYVYEELVQKIYENIIQEYLYNYDYYYLRNAINACMEQKIDTLITGSSYGLFGIYEPYLKGQINMSLQSQDLFYSFEQIESVCSRNENIKNIVLCIGYWHFFWDLSKTRDMGELSRISQTYIPVFQEEYGMECIHNAHILPKKFSVLYTSDIFDFEKILKHYSESEFLSGYWNEKFKNRMDLATRNWKDSMKRWIDLSEEEKVEAANIRTRFHNKLSRRQYTVQENERLFCKLVDYTAKRNIRLLIVVPPVTSFYRDRLNAEIQNKFYEILDKIESEIHLLDLTNADVFEDKDFIDTDHLNDIGAQKMTTLVLEEISNR